MTLTIFDLTVSVGIFTKFINIKIAVFIQPQDALDVRYLNQLTDNKNDHKAFVPVFQYNKGTLLFLS